MYFSYRKRYTSPTSALHDSNLRRITFLKNLHSDLKAVGSSACKPLNFYLITVIVSMYSKKGCRKIGPQRCIKGYAYAF